MIKCPTCGSSIAMDQVKAIGRPDGRKSYFANCSRHCGSIVDIPIEDIPVKARPKIKEAVTFPESVKDREAVHRYFMERARQLGIPTTKEDLERCDDALEKYFLHPLDAKVERIAKERHKHQQS